MSLRRVSLAEWLVKVIGTSNHKSSDIFKGCRLFCFIDLRSEVVVRLVDVDGIVDHLCLNFLSIMGFRHLYIQGLGFTGQFTSITVFSQLVCYLI